MTIELMHFDSHFLLAVLPPGAFLAMGLFIAAKNAIDAHIAAKQPKLDAEEITRVRVTKVSN
jgi:electron transport complex protein RnfE